MVGVLVGVFVGVLVGIKVGVLVGVGENVAVVVGGKGVSVGRMGVHVMVGSKVAVVCEIGIMSRVAVTKVGGGWKAGSKNFFPIISPAQATKTTARIPSIANVILVLVVCVDESADFSLIALFGNSSVEAA
jgi:hypothetical protein